MTWRQCLNARGALDPFAAAGALRRAREAGRTFDVLLSDELSLSLEDAYRVQDQVTALRLADGERLAGWKLGYTSAVMRAQMGVAAPNFGPLTDAMLLSSPALLPFGALQPRVEPEIGLRLGRRLAAPCSVESVLDACDAALACLEIVDSVWSGYRFTLEDNTADGSSAAWVAVGPSLPLDDLPSLPVALSVDGEVVERATGAAAGGHPAAGLAWLAGELAGSGRALEPGDLVITGGLTSARPLEAGHRVSAVFGAGRWSVTVRRGSLLRRPLMITKVWCTLETVNLRDHVRLDAGTAALGAGGRSGATGASAAWVVGRCGPAASASRVPPRCPSSGASHVIDRMLPSFRRAAGERARQCPVGPPGTGVSWWWETASAEEEDHHDARSRADTAGSAATPWAGQRPAPAG